MQTVRLSSSYSFTCAIQATTGQLGLPWSMESHQSRTYSVRCSTLIEPGAVFMQACFYAFNKVSCDTCGVKNLPTDFLIFSKTLKLSAVGDPHPAQVTFACKTKCLESKDNVMAWPKLL